MTDDELDVIEARAEAATSDTLAQAVFCASAFSAPNATVLQDVANAVADWRKIARTDVPALVAEVRRLRGVLQWIADADRGPRECNCPGYLDGKCHCCERRARAALAPPTTDGMILPDGTGA